MSAQFSLGHFLVKGYMALLFLAALNLNAFAQPIDDNIGSPSVESVIVQFSGAALTEEEVIASALKSSRKLQSLNTNVEIANYRLKSSGWIRNPELRVSEISTRYYTDANDELQVGLRLRVPKPGELGEEKQQARVEFWDRKVGEIRYRDDLVARVRRSYATVLMYDQEVEIARQRLVVANERITVIKKLVDFGHRSIVYFTKAKMWHAESKNDYALAVQRQGLGRRTLAKRAGIAEDTPLIMEALPEINRDVESLIEIAFTNRPEIKLVEQRIELAVRQNNFEFYKIFPWPNFIDVSYHVEEPNRGDWAEFMMGVELPLFNWNRGNIKATNLAVKKKEDESDAVRESIAEEVRTAYEIYKDILLDWNNFKTNADTLISNAENVVAQAREHETLMPDEVLEMELTILDTQKLLSEKRRDLAHALVDLCYAIGVDGHSKLTQQ